MSWVEKFKRQIARLYKWILEEEDCVSIGLDDEDTPIVLELKNTSPEQTALEKILDKFNTQTEILVLPENYRNKFGSEIELKLDSLKYNVIYFPEGTLNNIAVVKIGYGLSYAQ